MKRVLTITPYAIGDTHSLGITMQKMFCNWNRDNLFQIYMSEENLEREHRFLEYLYDDLWYLHNNKDTRKTKKTDESSYSDITIKHKIKASLKDKMPVLIPKDLINMLDDFKPEIIYVQLYSVRMCVLTQQIKKKYDVPLVIHQLDDWIENGKKYRLRKGKFFEKKAKKLVKELVQKSTYVFGVSPMMCNYIACEFGKKALFVAPYTAFPNTCPKYEKGQGTLKLLYTGNIEGGRYITIKKAIESLNEIKLDYRLEIYTRQGHFLTNYSDKHLYVYDAIPQNEVEKLLRDADGLIHVESFKPEDKKWAKYSLSTKISEYLASGRPIFYLGPYDIGTGDFLKDGFAECSENERDFAEKIRLFFDKDNKEISSILSERFERAKTILSDKKMGKIIEGWYK